jgi:RND family efflux transporter MFP subunit
MAAFRLSGALAAALLLAGCQQKATVAEAPPPSRPVLIAQVHYEPHARVQALPGVLKARIESDLAFRVSGRIERRLVDVGAFVHAGDPLAKLDENDLRLQVESAEADRGSARAALDDAEAEEKRVTTLSKQGWASNSEFDRIRSTADQARRALEKAERAAHLARNSLDYATLTADADGVVSAVLAEPGQVVAAGAPVLRLEHTAEKEAAVAIPEIWVERARAAKASVDYWALPGARSAAELRELSPNADPATRTYAARFRLPDAPAGARLGMSVTVALSDGEPPLARVPLGAIFITDKGPQVWTVDKASGAVTATPVVIATSDADSAYLASGAPEGAEIIALGVHKIDPHEKVRVVSSLAGI